MTLAFGLIALFMVLGMPVAFALLIGVYGYFVISPIPDGIFIQRAMAGVTSFPLLAVPFFVLAGTAMAKGGIARRLLLLAGMLVGNFRGALAQINVLNSFFMGGISGSANADAAIDAKVLVPIMIRNGYTRGFASALSAATGMIAPVLPPSIGLIIYGLLAEVSVGRLFMAGIIPGALMAVALTITVRILSVRRGYSRLREERVKPRQLLLAIREAIWALLLPVFIIVGLRIGVFTPTELGAFLAAYALLVSVFIYREIKPSQIIGVLKDAALTSALIMMIVAAGSTLSYVLTWERLPQGIIAFLTGLSDNTFVILLLINLVLLIMGMFMESVALLVIITPMVVPLMNALGVDLIHFGIVLVVNLTIGGMTPPVGTVMYTVLSITRSTVAEFTREGLPLLLTLLIVLMLLTFLPALSLFLPNALL